VRRHAFRDAVRRRVLDDRSIGRLDASTRRPTPPPTVSAAIPTAVPEDVEYGRSAAERANPARLSR